MVRSSDKCPRYSKISMVLDGNGSEYYRASCVLVVRERIVDTGPEWRSFSGDGKGDGSRAGIPSSIAIHDMGPATVLAD